MGRSTKGERIFHPYAAHRPFTLAALERRVRNPASVPNLRPIRLSRRPEPFDSDDYSNLTRSVTLRTTLAP